jgi:hypothetical protein
MLTSVKYPIKIYCVISENTENTEIEEIKEHTSNLGIHFHTRHYDSRKYSDDRYNITSLPAFHIYYGRSYVKTFHETPLDTIDDCVREYEKKQIEKKKGTRIFKKILERFWKSK